MPNECLGNRPQRNEILIWERGRQPEKGVGVKPSGLIGDDRTPVQLATKVELLGEKFCRRFDRAVSQKRVGRGGLATGAAEPKL